MKKQKIVIKNPTGLHLKPAGILCETAVGFQCEISFRVRNTQANAKSILSVLGACVKCGDEIELECNGVDEDEAMDTIIQTIRDKIGE